jgi:hypothetical protein
VRAPSVPISRRQPCPQAAAADSLAWSRLYGNRPDTGPASAVAERARATQALARVRKAASFTTPGVDLLREAFLALERDAAPVMDGLTWWAYAAGLGGRPRCSAWRRIR